MACGRGRVCDWKSWSDAGEKEAVPQRQVEIRSADNSRDGTQPQRDFMYDVAGLRRSARSR